MEMTISNVTTIAAYLVTFGILLGSIKVQLKAQGERFEMQLKAQGERFEMQLRLQGEMFASQLINLQDKVERHNNVVERTYKVESSAAAAHKRLDTMERRNNNAE